MSESDAWTFFTLAGLYILPSLWAWHRRHRQAAAITAVNLLLGWIGALVWSLTNPAPAAAAE